MRRPVAVLALVVVVAAACGDDGETDAGSPFDGSDDIQDTVDDILDDIQSGDADPEDVLEDAKDTAEDFLEGFGGSGSGTVSVNGETIDFESETCFAGQGDFLVEGLGSASDGTPVWVSINYTEDSREEMLEFMDEDTVDLAYGDADPIISQAITVDFGRDEMFASSTGDMPSFDASSTGDLTTGDGVAMQVSGSSLSGSGEAADYNFVAGDFDDTFPITFEARCD